MTVQRADDGPLGSTAILSTIRDLVGFAPRATGSHGGAKTVAYLQDRYRAAGISDIRVLEEPSYNWHADRCTLTIDDRAIPCSPIQHCAVADDSQVGSLVDGTVTGRIVDIGAGSVREDVRGAVVMFDLVFEVPLSRMKRLTEGRYDPDGIFEHPEILGSRNPFQTSMLRVMDAAAKAGAVAAIGVLRDYPESLGYHNEYFTDEPMTIPGVWVTATTGKEIRERLVGQSTAEIDLLIQREEVTSQTVIAVIPGRTKDAVMIQSHHDSVTPGAVEDASGTAEVLALAEHFAGRDASGRQREKTLLFVTFDTHFTGYHAHRRFVADYVYADEREFDIVLNATIEHVGLRAVRGVDGGFELAGGSEPRGIFENLNLAWKRRLVRLLRTHGLAGTSLLFGTLLEFSGEGIPTDAAHIMSAGIPTLSLVSGPLYLYDDADQIDKVDVDQLGPVAAFFADVVDAADTAKSAWIGLIPRPLRRLLPRQRW